MPFPKAINIIKLHGLMKKGKIVGLKIQFPQRYH